MILEGFLKDFLIWSLLQFLISEGGFWALSHVALNFSYVARKKETNNAFRIVAQTYFNSELTIDFCVVKVFMVLL